MVNIDEPTIQAILQALITLIMALVAWWKAQQAKRTENAFIPGTPESQNPKVIASLPARSWKMDDATLHWLIFDATPENKQRIIDQVNAAELEHLATYQINFAGGFYNIEYGLLKGGAGNPSGKKTN